jgi:hypothetical protein
MKTFELIPIACNIDAISGDQLASYQSVREALETACTGIEERPQAVAFRYPARPELLAAASEWIGLDRRCCAFLGFELSVAPGENEFTLQVGGSEAAKAFVLANMVPSDAATTDPVS